MPRMRFFGVGDLLPDLAEVPAETLNFCASAGAHLRCSMDARKTWGPYHARIEECSHRDITLLPILHWTYDGVTQAYPADQASRDYWQTFCRDISSVVQWQWNAGRPSVAQFEIWNEPNIPRDGLGTISVYDYVGNILKPARTGIKQSGGAAIIVGGLAFGSNGSRIDALTYIKRLYGRDSNDPQTYGISYAPYFDAIGIHPYGKTRTSDYVSEYWDKQTVARAVAEIDRAIAARNGSERIMVTETGRPSQVFPHSETSQREFLEQLYAAVAARPAVQCFSNWHSQDRPGQPNFTIEMTTGLHRSDWRRKPAGDWFVIRSGGWTENFPKDA